MNEVKALVEIYINDEVIYRKEVQPVVTDYKNSLYDHYHFSFSVNLAKEFEDKYSNKTNIGG